MNESRRKQIEEAAEILSDIKNNKKNPFPLPPVRKIKKRNARGRRTLKATISEILDHFWDNFYE